MASKRRGAVPNLTVEILKQIRDEVRGVKTELHLVKTEVQLVRTELKAEIHELRVDTNARLDLHAKAITKLVDETRGIKDRMDNFLRGAHHDDHVDLRERVARLEAKVG